MNAAGEVRAESLAPGTRAHAHTPDQLSKLLLKPCDEEWSEAFTGGLTELASAQREAFPDNIYGDLDFIAAEVLRQGRAAASQDLIVELFERMCELQGLYGKSSAIRFRYVHDFTYGYDWAKWVRREAGQDGSIGPFDLGFLEYMRRRGYELLRLIEEDDLKYPSLRDAGHRNPFPFSREPECELRLLPELARRGWIPVETWRIDASARFDEDFAELRVSCAAELGLLIDPAA